MRRTPLKPGESRLTSRTSLVRYTGLPQATAPLARRQGLQVASPLPVMVACAPPRTAGDKPGQERTGASAYPFPAAVRALIDARDVAQPDEVRCCQRCGATSGLHRHHRRGKADGGSQHRPHAQCVCNAVVLCTVCHIWAHTTGRALAEAQGFIVSQAVDWPGAVSVMRFTEGPGGASQYPSCDGRWLDWIPEPDGELAA